MLTGKIEFRGKTMSDVRDAVEEALSRIEAGNTSGGEWGYPDSGFAIEVSGEDEAAER